MEFEIQYALSDVQRFIHFLTVYMRREFYSIKNSIIGRELLIYYTGLNPMSDIYLDKWKEMDCNINYYSVNHCALMLKNNFNSRLEKLFDSKRIPGIKKVLMFKLSIMYIKMGVVIDPNLIPYISPNNLKDDEISSYIVISTECRLNVMMMANTSTRQSLLFLTLFLAYIYAIGQGAETIEDDARFLYEKLAYSISTHCLIPNTMYHVDEVKYTVTVPCSNSHSKMVDLVWFPIDQIYRIEPQRLRDKKRFEFNIDENMLCVRENNSQGWEYSFHVDIIFEANETLCTLVEELTDRTKYKIKKDEIALVHCDTGSSHC